MWSYDHSQTTTASPEAIWPIITDVNNWPAWDKALEAVHLEGPVTVGAKGKLKPKTAPRQVSFVITDLKENSYFADNTKLPLGELRGSVSLSAKDGKTEVKFTITITG